MHSSRGRSTARHIVHCIYHRYLSSSKVLPFLAADLGTKQTAWPCKHARVWLLDMRGTGMMHSSCQQTPRCPVAAAPVKQLQQYRGPGLCQASKQQACTVSVDPLEPVHITCNGPTCRIPIMLTAAGAIAAAYWFKRQAELPKRKLPEPWPEIPRPEVDPEAYQKALARTRQAQCVQRAIGYMRANEPSRAMVELHLALEENSICRSPLLQGHQTHSELTALYQLHIQNTEVPPNFAVLLQLRELLGLGADEAEDLEKQVLKEAEAFSI